MRANMLLSPIHNMCTQMTKIITNEYTEAVNRKCSQCDYVAELPEIVPE